MLCDLFYQNLCTISHISHTCSKGAAFMNHKFLKYHFFKSKFVRFSFITLLFILFLTLLFSGVHSYLTAKQSQKLDTLIQSLTYTEDNVDSEIILLESFTHEICLSKEAYAKLYKALAEISYMTGNHSLYNEYIANAIYYAEQIQDVESVIYLTNKYIGLLYSTGCFEAAEKILEHIAYNYDIHTFSIDIQTSYYLSCADVAQMLKKQDAEALENAHNCIENMEESAERRLFQTKIDLLTARNYIQNEDYESAKRIVSKYDESDNFGLEDEQVYVVCDFQIPYYVIMAKILLHDGDTTQAYKNIDRYIMACDNYNFRGMKLRMLQYVDDHSSKGDIQKYLYLKNQTVHENLTELTNQYGNFLLSDIDKTSTEKKEQAQKRETIIQEIIFKIILVYIGFLVYYIILFIIDCANRDELTGLYNRRKYVFFL